MTTPAAAPGRLTRAQARARTRDALLDAAADVFAHHGYAGASVEQIAATAGYTVGALYSNFASKRELFLALFERYVAERVAEIEMTLAEPDLPARRAAFNRLLVRLAETGTVPAMLAMEFWLYAQRDAELLERLRAPWLLPHAPIAAAVADEMPEASAAHVDEVATAVRALFDGLLTRRRVDPESVPDHLFGRALVWLLVGAGGSGVGISGVSPAPGEAG